MKTVLVVLSSSLALLAGCSMNPITEGSYKTLPQRNTRVIIWGGHPSAAEMAATWLGRRGVIIVDRARVQRVIDEQHFVMKDTSPDTNQILRIAKLATAEMLVLVETPFTRGEEGAPYVGPYGGGILKRTVYVSNVSIRGLNVETGEIAWSGTARYPGSYDDLDRGLRELTCQALATAWGFRPPGHYSFKSQDMCDL